MRDTRQQREVLATFVVAGIAAVIGNHYLGPAIRGKLKVKK